MNPVWSWALTIIGVTGWWLVGNKKRFGFAVGFAVQFLWIAYAVTTKQWGFVASACLYGFVSARNWLAWSTDADDPVGVTPGE